MGQDSQEISFELTSKDSFPKFNFTPVSVTEEDHRKKSDSAYLRMSLKDGIGLRLDEENQKTQS